MQKKCLPSIQLNESISSSCGHDTSLLYKTSKTVLICFAFLVMGIYVEIIGLTIPDMKLQYRLYESHESISLGLALSSIAILAGYLFLFVSIVFLNFKTRCTAIFSFSSKIDLTLSISFFCAAAGTLLIPFARDLGIESYYTSSLCIGFAQGALLIGGSLLLIKTWYYTEHRVFLTKFRFLIVIFYAFGALFATLLTRFFLVPLLYEYRDYYRDSINDTRNYLKVYEFSTTPSRQTTTQRSRIPTRPTPRTTTSSAKPLPDLTILDFLRYDSNDLYDENDTMHRIFAQNFFYLFYVVSGICATTMICFLVYYVIELRITSKTNSNVEHHELSTAAKATASHQQASSSFLKRLRGYLSEHLHLDLLSLMVTKRRESLNVSTEKSNVSIYVWNVIILVFLTFFYAFVYASHKIQTNFLTTFSVQSEYLRKTLQNNEIIGIEAKITGSNNTGFLSFTESYAPISVSLIDANYASSVYYVGVLLGGILNLILVNNKYLTIKPILLAHTNCILHLLTRTLMIAFASNLFDTSDAGKSMSVWFIVNFLTGLFISSLPALLHEYLSCGIKKSVTSNLQFQVLSKYLSLVELLSLSIGVAVFQYSIGSLFDTTKTFNAFINLTFLNAVAMVVLLLLVHVFFKYIPRKYRLINPS